jgi:lipid-A-disaccharide synthase
MKNCKTALAKSGTVTLELALHGVPTVVHYELSFLNYLLAKYLLRLQLSHYCIVNILSHQTIFPEFMGHGLVLAPLKNALESIHFNPQQYQQIQEACEKLKQQLGNQSSYRCAIRAIEELIE